MYVKIHTNERCKLLAVCDEKLLGSSFKEGKMSIKVEDSFYNGEIKTEKEVEELLPSFDNFVVIGDESVRLLLELELVSEDQIIHIQGVPYVSCMCV